MKKLYSTLSLLLVLYSSYAIELTLTMNYQNQARNFIVHFPPGYSAGSHLPVVFNFHGYGSDASQQEFYSIMDPVADANSFIVVYPNGIANSWNVGFTGTYNTGTDDVGFTSKMIDTLYQLYSIDLTRVYACGMSNGGFMSHRLACELENRIAAIASVTGSLTDSTAYYCTLQRRIPIMEVHGTADPLVPYDGEAGILSQAQLINFWLNKDQCPGDSDIYNFPDINTTTDSSTVQRIRYLNCSNNTRLWYYKITGGGHSWPGASYPYIYGPTNGDIDGATEIWKFFKQFTLNGTVGVEDLAAETVNIKVQPNPFNDAIQLSNLPVATNDTRINLFDLTGRLISTSVVNTSSTTITTTNLQSGLYLLQVSGYGFNYTAKVVKE